MDGTVLRSRPGRLILAAGLLVALVLGVVAVVVHRARGDGDRQAVAAVADPLTDDQARQQVLETARHFVQAGKMKAVNASYLLTSCTSEERPPYQGRIYLNFDVPRVAETRAYFAEIAGAMTARGWHEGLPPGRHPGGHTLAKDGLFAVYYRDPDFSDRGLLKIYGECRNTSDHSQDSSAFVDITTAVQR